MATRQSRMKKRSVPYHYYEPPPTRRKSKRRAKPIKTFLVRLLLIAGVPATGIVVVWLLTNFPSSSFSVKRVAEKPPASKTEVLERLQTLPLVVSSQKVSTKIQGQSSPPQSEPPLAGQAFSSRSNIISYTYYYSVTIEVSLNFKQLKAEQVSLERDTLAVQLPKATVLRKPDGKFEPNLELDPRRIKELQSFGDSELGVTTIEQNLVSAVRAEAIRQIEAATGYQVKIIAD
jgi:hypothetical protein